MSLENRQWIAEAERLRPALSKSLRDPSYLLGNKDFDNRLTAARATYLRVFTGTAGDMESRHKEAVAIALKNHLKESRYRLLRIHATDAFNKAFDAATRA